MKSANTDKRLLDSNYLTQASIGYFLNGQRIRHAFLVIPIYITGLDIQQGNQPANQPPQ